MSLVGNALQGLKEALRLEDDVKAADETLKDLARELPDYDRRITRLEAKWEAAIELSGRRGKVKQIDPKQT